MTKTERPSVPLSGRDAVGVRELMARDISHAGKSSATVICVAGRLRRASPRTVPARYDNSTAGRLAPDHGIGVTDAVLLTKSEKTRPQWGRVLPLTLAGVLLMVAGFSMVSLLTNPYYASVRGVDYGIYHGAAQRWLEGGPFYWPEQATGPYEVIQGHVLYPPVALVLFVPFVWLPTVLWWAMPLGILAWFIWTMRPGPWGLVGIAACLAWPITVELLVTGNPVMWVAAIFALSLRWTWLGPLVLIKPSLFPFALVGIRTWRWWVVLAVFALGSLSFLLMWPAWVAAVTNARGPFSGVFYSLKDVPLMLVPLVAWAFRAGGRLPIPSAAYRLRPDPRYGPQ